MALDPSMSVLVVDDYSTMIRIIRNLLRQIGFADVDDANNGAAALDKMRAKRYGLVISDWNMEPMTGYDLLQQVRSDPGLGNTPFIMVTAESEDRERDRGQEGGREQLYRQAVQRPNAQGKDRSGIRREQRTRRRSRALRPAFFLKNSSSASPHQSAHDRLRGDAGGVKHRIQRRDVRRLAGAVMLGMKARGHKHAIESERRGAG